jgi:transcriptional regulator with XRE-family HTH domain
LTMAVGPEAFARILRQNLISLRLEKKLSIKDAAAYAGLSRGGLEKIESGANLPSIDSLRLLCAAYDCTASALLANVDAQLAVAATLRKQFDTTGMDATERYALYREHARSVGRADELQVCDQLSRIKETNPELYTALCETIRAASGSQRS